MSKETVTPEQCAFLIGVPLSGAEFLAQVGQPGRDYATGFRESFRGASDAYASEEYERLVAQPLRAAADRAEKNFGVVVHRDATLESLRSAVALHPVVTLFTHARQEPFRDADFADADALAALLAAPGSLLSPAGRSAIAAQDGSLAEALNLILEQENDSYLCALAAGGEMPPNPVRRTNLEDAFPALVHPGRHAEFADGMATIEEIVGVIPHDWGGVLDLTLCEASILSASLKRRRPLPTLIGSRGYGFPLFRAKRYLLILELLHAAPQPYCDAFIEVTKRI